MDITVSGDIEQEFLALVRDILEDTEFQKLSLYRQHRKTTRLMHSINVSYISWLDGTRPQPQEQVCCMTFSYTHTAKIPPPAS